ncbi:CG0192-related protein [Jiangella anatolica]|uniref:Maltokinase N-terminal cap domain-containing protein n=1 Tax=Jiangella anatolica TaxID=2670374 RepID=A0A2W2CTX5_9ACTN|nr:hypothetical protein [Jiangella anatolica]PZF83613.1 hypothetical protein C1I92_11800 [Jiangella anatolica]
MARIHQATLRPTKLELLTGWLPERPWAGAGPYRQLGAYRFDDPAGEVGLEAHLIQDGDGAVLHVPLTYRGAPLPGAEPALVGTMEHSVLGPRWVYDGCADPVFVAALARVVVAGAPQAEELVDGQSVPREPSARVSGSGRGPDPALPEDAAVTTRDDGPATIVRAGDLELVVVRAVGTEPPTGADVLTGSWAGAGPVTLATVRRAC